MSLGELELRERIFAKLRVMWQDSPGYLTRDQLSGFGIDGRRIQLIAPMQGINNPRGLSATISVMSKPQDRYVDGSPDDGIWEYSFQGSGPGGDNSKMYEAQRLGLPIIYLEWIAPNLYVPYFPVQVVAIHEGRLKYDLALSELANLGPANEDSPVEREYRQVIVEQRMHQPKFRARVLHAYATQCTVCRFKHAELLDAAHILGDRHLRGDASVPNGMAMCKIHHAAYDRNFLGVTPDYEIRINADLLSEVDGPMLKHGLQEMHGQQLILPKRVADRPARDRLAERFATFSSI